jgi:hypothetical protein
MRILVCQMGGCASAKTREIKISATEKLIRKYHINLCLFMEQNYNRAKVNSSANLASWFTDDKRKTRCITVHNTKEDATLFGKHQPGGTGMLCQHEYLQYTQWPTANLRGLGFKAILLQSNPCHKNSRRISTLRKQNRGT